MIASFRYINIHIQTIDFSTRLREINYRVCGVYYSEPRCDVFCFKLNFKNIQIGLFKLTYIRLDRLLDLLLKEILKIFLYTFQGGLRKINETNMNSCRLFFFS